MKKDKKPTEKIKEKISQKISSKIEKPKPKSKPKTAAELIEVKACAKFVRMAPRKLRLVIANIRGKDTDTALNILKFTTKLAAKVLEKTLKSAIANAENNHRIQSGDLYVKTAFVDGGPTMKRFLPRAMGRASLIHKRTSHITIIVCEKGG